MSKKHQVKTKTTPDAGVVTLDYLSPEDATIAIAVACSIPGEPGFHRVLELARLIPTAALDQLEEQEDGWLMLLSIRDPA